MKDKIFHDTVHGDIRIPESYCDKIIDTLLFQRLRRVEQSSVRSLFPCARHDRFIHSIGVFYIGVMLSDWIEKNTEPDLYTEIKPYWMKVTESYKIACLLHDVGHAPFSHTFEKYYDVNEPDKLDNKLTAVIMSDEFKKDLSLMASAKPHEKVSAYLLASAFGSQVKELGGDCEYGVRMIIGCCYNNDNSVEKQLVNCFITALHGEVDADRLDYAVRDQWAAGFSSARIQIGRLLRSILIIRDSESKKLKVCYTKNAINEIESLSRIKDFQHRWVFCHQNVKYDQYVLEQAIEMVASIYANREHINQEDALRKIFNLDCFLNPDYQIENQSLYLISDDTILQMLRQTFSENEFAREWLSRNYSKKPIWKTFAEYRTLFKKNRGTLNAEKIKSKMEELGLQNKTDYVILEAEQNHFSFVEGRVWISINNSLVDVNDLLPQSSDRSAKIYYIYLSDNKFNMQDSIKCKIKEII